MRRVLVTTIAVVIALAAAVQFAGPSLAHACAGLIGSNGAVNLGRTTTLAAYVDGVEHYVTAFQFQGGGGEFGMLIPLPGVPSNVERGGAWTLQRLQLETRPQVRLAALSENFAHADAEVLLTVRIDALDITVLRGGGASVATWATDHGFRLSPDAPEVLDFYAERSPIFLAAVFDGEAAAARGQSIGDGTPVHITIPTDNPWVPLRLLALGKQPDDRVVADGFLLTAAPPALLPPRDAGLPLAPRHPPPPSPAPHVRSDDPMCQGTARGRVADLRSDDGMGWVPGSAWLTKLAVNRSAGDLSYDLAIDASGQNSPSPVAAGLVPAPGDTFPETATLAAATVLLLVLMTGVMARRRVGAPKAS